MKFNLILLFGFFPVFLIMQPLSVFAELIEPSRTVKGQEISNGRLSVFSEPPKLDVFLDDINIGKTTDRNDSKYSREPIENIRKNISDRLKQPE